MDPPIGSALRANTAVESIDDANINSLDVFRNLNCNKVDIIEDKKGVDNAMSIRACLTRKPVIH